MVTKAIPEFPTQSSEATLPLQSHHVDGDLNWPSPLHHLLFWSYSKFTPVTGTNKEELWVWKISLLKLQQSKTQGSATHEWWCPGTGHVRQAGLPSHPPEVSSWVIPAEKPLGSSAKSKRYLEAVTLCCSFAVEQGKGTYWEVNNCLDGLFFSLYEVIILQDKTQGLIPVRRLKLTGLFRNQSIKLTFRHDIAWRSLNFLRNWNIFCMGKATASADGSKTDPYSQ